MKALKLMMGRPFISNNRDKRELEVLHSLGCEVLVYCRYDDKADVENYPYQFVYEDMSPRLKPLIKHAGINVHYAKWVEAKRLSKLEPDIISGHNLPGLMMAWRISLFCKKKPALIYDSHEFTLGEVSEESRKIQRRVKRQETFLLPKCAFIIEVNDSIADRVQSIYNLKTRPIVVRSTPLNWNLDNETIKTNRKEFLKANGLPENTFVLVTLGRIVKDNGIFECIKAIEQTENTALLAMGPFRSSRDLENAREMVRSKKLENRVIFHDSLPQNEIWKLAGIADASFCLIKNNHQSFYLSLPNKLFESVQAMVPIIGSNFPEIQHTIDKYGIGICCDPDNIKEIVNTIIRLKSNKQEMQLLKKNLIIAKEELCWENEQQVLKNAYQNVIESYK